MVEEVEYKALTGPKMLLVAAVIVVIAAVILFISIATKLYFLIAITGILVIASLVMLCGLFSLDPNQAVVVQFCGYYKGTIRKSGLSWCNPFYGRKKIFVGLRNMQTARIKVNDYKGNPIFISAVVVWRIKDTAKSVYEVDNFEHFMSIQSHSALRFVAGLYPYDAESDEEVSLRASKREINDKLIEQLEERLNRAGIAVEEAYISDLAYSEEIAAAMLRRQQAEAVIAARKSIVNGALQMVESAILGLERRELIRLDNDVKGKLVSNLLVILCGEDNAKPVLSL